MRGWPSIVLLMALVAGAAWGETPAKTRVKRTAKEAAKTGGRTARDGALTLGRTTRDFFKGGAAAATRRAAKGE